MIRTVSVILARLASWSWSWRAAAAALSCVLARNADPRMRVVRGFCRELAGLSESARRDYSAALRRARTTDSIGEQRWLHVAQFFLERRIAVTEGARVRDPLFACTIGHTRGVPGETRRGTGYVRAAFIFSGLQILGYVPRELGSSVTLYLDDTPIRTIKVRQTRLGGVISFLLLRGTIERFPRNSRMTVRAADGTSLLVAPRKTALDLTVPHGDGTLTELVQAGTRVTKKGGTTLSLVETRAAQDAYLELYGRARDVFDRVIGKQLFLFYGTLLGYYRSGDFIPDDDDFDAGYVSDCGDPLSVKRETLAIIASLIEEGVTIAFNSRGRLFRIQLPEQPGIHIDARPIWFQDGNVWAHNHFSMPAERSDYLPVETGALRGTSVYYPRNTELFLQGQYGPGWRVPDPGFTYNRAAFPQAMLENLDRSLITPGEYRAFTAGRSERTADDPNARRFISLAAADMYPLESTDLEFE